MAFKINETFCALNTGRIKTINHADFLFSLLFVAWLNPLESLALWARKIVTL